MTLTYQEFVKKHKIRMVATPVDSNPNMSTDHPMNHYLCNLGRGDRTMEVHFSQGLGIKGKPDAVSVIACLADDARSVEDTGSFEEWAGDLGFDEDSRRRMVKVYKEVQEELKMRLVTEGGHSHGDGPYHRH